jgi:hypothetical protein
MIGCSALPIHEHYSERVDDGAMRYVRSLLEIIYGPDSISDFAEVKNLFCIFNSCLIKNKIYSIEPEECCWKSKFSGYI